MKLIPANGRVVVKRLDAETVSQGGIVIPDSAQKKSQRGEVVAVSSYRTKEGNELSPLFSVGEVMIFPLYAGEEMSVGNDKYLFLQEETILGRIISE